MFFPLDDMSIVETPEDTLSKKKMFFEVGAKYRSDNRHEAPGGCATNVAQGLARLDIPTALFAAVGSDVLGAELRAEVSKEGVDIARVSQKEGKTDIGMIIVDAKSGERVIVYNRDSNEAISLDSDTFVGVNAVFMSGLYGNWRENLRTVSNEVSARGIRLFYNPSGSNISQDALCVWEVCCKCEGIFLNKDEAMELVLNLNGAEIFATSFDEGNIEDEASVAKFLAEKSRARFVVITDGSRGAWTYDANTNTASFQRGKNVPDIKDTTGAGDAFASGYIAAILSGENAETALMFGIANSSSVIRHYGAKEGLLRLEEMRERISFE
jgi:ribokinase